MSAARRRPPPDVSLAADLLDAQAAAIAALCRPLPRHLAAWRPPDGSWSALIVCGHLLDEEREDFRPRLRATLEDPARGWPGIAPEEWVAQRGYEARELGATLDAFLAERRDSTAWLRGLGDAAWDNAHEHHRLGRLGARDLLAAWLDHDRLHLRQVVRVLHRAGEAVVPGGRPDYAGSW